MMHGQKNNKLSSILLVF